MQRTGSKLLRGAARACVTATARKQWARSRTTGSARPRWKGQVTDDATEDAMEDATEDGAGNRGETPGL